jgi:hypothetical protein
MKNMKFFYSIVALSVIVTTVMSILHIPNGKTLSSISFLALIVLQMRHIWLLEQQLKESKEKVEN